MNREEITKCLMETELFSLCGEQNILYSKKLFHKGDIVCDSLNGVPCVGVIAEGEINVYSTSGKEEGQNVSTLGKGDMFGICNILAKKPMPTLLKCLKKATVAYIDKDLFVSFMFKYPEFALAYARICNEKIMFLAQKLNFSNIPTASGKVRTYLMRNSEGKENMSVDIPSKETLCRFLGISRASLFRELTKLRDQGFIEIHENSILILKEIIL